MVGPGKLIIIAFGLVAGFAGAQNSPGTELRISKAKGEIEIDGILNETDWMSAQVANNFFLNYPTDTIASPFQTEARVTFNDQNFYVSFVCYDDDKPVVVQSLRRDYEWPFNDNVSFTLDPYNDFTNGFFFGVTPYGAQREGAVSLGGVDQMNSFNTNWDNKWYSAVKRYPDKWVVEMAIPFKSIRYNSAVNWNIAFVRKDIKHNMTSGWIRTPIQNIPGSFPFTGKLVWETPPPQPGTNISVIPYVISSSYKDFENKKHLEYNPNAGFDLKVGLTPSMNLDMTFNPDFSTVEVDKQVVNLTRYEIQFPERRQFFLENSDLFSSPGFTTFTQPFFTRRIGLARDTSGNLQRVPILYGARISGKIGSGWRLGIMNLQTRKNESIGLPGQNYSVMVIQRQIFSRSNLGFVFINKQSPDLGVYDSTKFYHESLLAIKKNGMKKDTVLNRYNRIIGVDFQLITKTNRWGGKIYYHRSFDSYQSGNNYSTGSYLTYNRRNLRLGFGGLAIGKDFNAEVGFMPGQDLYKGYFANFIFVDVPIYPTSNLFVQHMPGFEIINNYLPDGTLAEINSAIKYSAKFTNTAELKVSAMKSYQRLPSDFNPLYPHGDTTLLLGQEYTWHELRVEFTSDNRKLFTFMFTGAGGQYYNGHRIGFGGILTYRVQPYGNFSVTYDYNDIRLPAPYGSAKFLLVSPRLDLTLSKKLFFTSFLQYNDRYNNVNLNTRFQWRFRPASDFFIVYAENYLPGSMASKNRSLVFKLTYWLNI